VGRRALQQAIFRRVKSEPGPRTCGTVPHPVDFHGPPGVRIPSGVFSRFFAAVQGALSLSATRRLKNGLGDSIGRAGPRSRSPDSTSSVLAVKHQDGDVGGCAGGNRSCRATLHPVQPWRQMMSRMNPGPGRTVSAPAGSPSSPVVGRGGSLGTLAGWRCSSNALGTGRDRLR